MSEMAPAATASAPSGLVLGRYRPIRPLGSGGSGSVWLARDEASGLDVALKIVAREGKAAARAEREVAAAARLRHPHCIRAYALAHDEEHVYIAYEFVPGRTFREAMRAGELDDAAAVEAGAQVLDGLAHAHGRGIVHRDVKPSNVLLADGDAVDVRLLDFGLARMEEAETLTAMGDVPGTLAYIAPERLSGEPATPASDVWATGVMLWEALAGRHPFWRPSLLESARAIEAGAPSLGSVRADLPKALVATVDRALELDPRRRPEAARLAATLRGVAAARTPARRPNWEPSWLAARIVPALLAAVCTGWVATKLPFYPNGGVPLLVLLAALTSLLSPRAGLAFALAVPVLPLGNHSLGLALVYAAAAVIWLAIFAREPRGGFLFVAGPLLAPFAALGFLPLVCRSLRSPLRRAAATAGAVLAAALVAGIRETAVPLSGAAPPSTLGIAGTDHPGVVLQALADILGAQNALWACALALAAAAALLPFAAARGPWAIAIWGAATLAATLLPSGGVPAPSLVVTVWITCAVVGLVPKSAWTSALERLGTARARARSGQTRAAGS
jgi:eukaryotic-like serine/threonine-protein kinase